MTKTPIPYIKSVAKTTLFMVLMFFFTPIKAQTYFHKYLEPTLPLSIFQQTDGNFILVGATALFNASSPSDITFIKIDSLGEIMYRKDISSAYFDDVYFVMQDDDKIFVGSVSGPGNSSDTNKRSITAIDLEGNLIWHGRYGNHKNIASYTTSIAISDNKDLVALATLPVNDSTGLNGFSVFVTDSNGVFKFGKAFYSNFGIGANAIFKSKTDNSYLILGGYCPLSFPCFGLHFITKIDENLNVVWSKSYQNALYDYVNGVFAGYILPRKIIEKDDGNFILYGSVVDSSENTYNPFLSVFDPNGNTLYSKSFSYGFGTGYLNDNFITTKDSGYILLGTSNNSIALLKLDENLNLEWIKDTYSNKLVTTIDIKQINGNEYIFFGEASGYSQTFSGASLPIGIIKTDKFGNSGCFERDTFATSYPIMVYDSVFTLQSYDEGFQSPSSTTTFFSPMQSYTHCFCSVTGGFTFTATGDTVEFTNTTIGASSYTWNFGDGNFSNDFSPTHVYDTSGTFNVSLIVQDGICKDTVYATITIVGVKEIENPLNFSVYPNPSFSENVQFTTTEHGSYQLIITDLTGKLIDKTNFTGKQHTYQSKQLSTGLYFYELTNENNVKSRGKLVKR